MSTIIKHKEFPKFKSWTMDLCGRPLTIEVGKVAELASASAMVKYGETTVMVAVTVSPRPRDGVDFFPLSVDFEEKLYAVGRIPGSFMRREGRPSLPAVLASRLIDRPMRPLFPYDFRNDVCIQCTVMSVDYDCSPEVAAMIGASACVSYSEIPFAGPIGCLEVGYVDGQIVLNPNQEQRKTSRMDVTVAATAEKVVMIEAGADEIPDEIMYAGIVKAHEEIKKQVAFINQIVAEIGKPKMEYEHAQFNQELFDKIVADFMDEAKAAMDTDDKNVRETRWNAMIDHWHEKYLEEYPDMDQYLEEFTYKFQKKIVKKWLLEGHRVDSRRIRRRVHPGRPVDGLVDDAEESRDPGRDAHLPRLHPHYASAGVAVPCLLRFCSMVRLESRCHRCLRAGVHPVGRRRAGRSGAWRIAVDSQSAVRIELRTGVEPVADLLPGDSAAGCSPYAAGIRKLGDTYRQNDIIGRAARCGRGHQGRPADYRREPIPVPDRNLVDLWRDFLYVLHRVLAAVHCGPPTGKEVVE